jgi:hypothetical protein
MKWFPALLLSFFLAACSPAKGTESTSPYHVEITADADRISPGGIVTVVGTCAGAYENPRYYITVTDSAPAASGFEYVLNPDNSVFRSEGSSAVLELASAEIRMSVLTAVFRGRAAGAANVTFGVNGQIGERDSTGHWRFEYISRVSGPMKIAVG